MTKRSSTRGLRQIDVDLDDRQEFVRRYLDECPHGGLLVDLRADLSEEELVELDVCFLDSNSRHRIKGVVLWCRSDFAGGSKAGVGFLPTEASIRESLLSSQADSGTGQQPELIRKQRRYTTTLKVTYQTTADFVVDYTRNISTGGIFINSKRPPALGSSIMLYLHPPGENEPIELAGEVAWRQPGQGFGVRFSRSDQGPLKRLSNLVRHLAISAPEQIHAPVVEEITS